MMYLISQGRSSKDIIVPGVELCSRKGLSNKATGYSRQGGTGAGYVILYRAERQRTEQINEAAQGRRGRREE